MIAIISVMFLSIQTVTAQEQSGSQESPNWVTDFVSGIQSLINQIMPITPIANTELTTLTEHEKSTIPQSIKSYEIKNLNGYDTREKIKNDQNLTINFKGKQLDLQVWEYNLKSQNATSYIRDENGNKIQVENEDAKTYRGFVKGDPKSTVTLVITPDNISGFIHTVDTIIAIEPITFHGQDLSKNKQIVYSLDDMNFEMNLDNDVGSNDAGSIVSQSTDISLLELILPKAAAIKVANVITDCDGGYYTLGTSNWQSRQLTIIGGMNSAYAETSVSMNVVQQNCNNISLNNSNTISGVLTELRNDWLFVATSRDYVLGFIGTAESGSIIGEASAIQGICDPNNTGYAVFQTVGELSGYTGSILEQKILASHESGHLLGATHTNTLINGFPSIMYATIGPSNVIDFTSGSVTEITSTATTCL